MDNRKVIRDVYAEKQAAEYLQMSSRKLFDLLKEARLVSISRAFTGARPGTIRNLWRAP